VDFVDVALKKLTSYCRAGATDAALGIAPDRLAQLVHAK
jgi:hypothetical protein